MKSSVTISLVPEAKGGPFVFWEDLEDACRQAAELGFHAMEIFPGSGELLRDSKAAWPLQKYDLRLAAVGSGAGWLKHKLTLVHPEAEVRLKAKAFLKDLIEATAEFHSNVIIGSMQGRAEGNVTREQALGYLKEALDELGEYAQQRRVGLFYEPLNRYETNLMNRVEQVLPFMKTLKTMNVKVLADLFHMNIEEASIPGAIRQLGPMLGHVHFADSNRRPVGFGHTEMTGVINALRDIGYAGYLSAECLPYPDPSGAAAQTIKSFKQLAG